MKVAYILNIFPKISETFILNEILEMQKKGVTIEVFAYKDEKENTVHPGAKEVTVRYLRKVGFFENLFSHFYWIWRAPKNYLKTWSLVIKNGEGIRQVFISELHDTVVVDRAKPEHLHAHFGDECSNLAMLIRSLSGVPFTFTTHSYDIFEHKYDNWKIKSRLAKKHVTISEYNKNYIVDRLDVDERDIAIVHCGIDFSKIPAQVQPRSRNLIVCIARLHEEKGMDVLINACRCLKDQKIDFECLIAGEGPAREVLEKQIKQQELKQAIRLLGNQTHDEVFELLKQAKIMVLASRSEGIPVSLMEAMAFRLPVIATRICGIPELVEDGQSGFLVPPNNVEVLAGRMKELLENEMLQKTFAENGYRKVHEGFDLKKETDKLLAIWRLDAKEVR